MVEKISRASLAASQASRCCLLKRTSIYSLAGLSSRQRQAFGAWIPS
jgi:hypothetical protein